MIWKHPVCITCVKLKYLNKYVYHCKFIYTGWVKKTGIIDALEKKNSKSIFWGILEIKKN